VTPPEPVAAGIALGVGLLGAIAFSRGGVRRRANYRGVELPLSLGPAFVVAVTAGWVALERDALRSAVGGLLLLGLFGWIDDRFASETRGIVGHLRSLLGGRVTTGILKILAGFAAAVFVVFNLGEPLLRKVVGVVLIAAATNLANVLDVAPGRALKAFLPVQAVVLSAVWGSPAAVIIAASIGGALAVLPFDLRERGMLGDAGSNPLGYLAGVGLYLALPLWALIVALGAVLALQVLAETVTLSRVIAAVPPLRWYDRLGRRPAEEIPPVSGPVA
jgi:UDP-N-acetylmuramyl pentapeptide phosphotransferase/UDP-N-acetylglucosamine-1-phosphate transferase